MKTMKKIIIAISMLIGLSTAWGNSAKAQSLEETSKSVMQEISGNENIGSDVSVSFEEVGSTQSSLEYYNNKTAAARALKQGMLKRQNTIQIGMKFTSEQDFDALKKELENMACEHTKKPNEGDYLKHHIYSIQTSGNYKYVSSDSLFPYYYTIIYEIDYLTTLYQENQVEKTADSIFQAFKDRGYNFDTMTDYEKIETLYGYLVYTVVNDKNYATKSESEQRLEHAAYSALCNQSSICSGYALALYYLLNKAGIDTRYIGGYGRDARHAWNIARLNGKYYYLDATWDAEASSYRDDLQYFLLGSNNTLFKKYHNSDSEYKQSDFTNKYRISTTDYSETQDQHIIHLDTNGERGANEVFFREYTVTNGKTYGDYHIPFSITMKGYKFLGWYTQKTGGTKINASTVIDLSADQTLYGHWEAITYVVRFNACGGSLTETSRAYTGYKKYGVLPVPTASSYRYRFAGWYTTPNNESGVEKKADDEIIFQNHTLYARWIDIYEIDTDRDGLSDGWELYGADIDDDGIVEIDLPALHADPNIPDIFVEVDWMKGLKPNEDALFMVVQSFAKHKISLHIDAGAGSKNYYIDPKTKKLQYSYWTEQTSGGEEVPYSDNFHIGDKKSDGSYSTDPWEAFAKEHFARGRESVFKYCTFINKWNNRNDTGLSNNIPGQYFLICDVDGYLHQGGSNVRIAGTFMHELGHTLGLRHGGMDDINNKPNYLSVMNYSFQTNGYVGINYSDYVLPDLYEYDLDEYAGIDPDGVTKDQKIYTRWCKLSLWGKIVTYTEDQSLSWIDFNNNGVIEKGIRKDVNGDGMLTILRGSWNDWKHLVFKSYGIGKTNALLSERFTAGKPAGREVFEEMTVTEAKEMEKNTQTHIRDDSVKVPQKESQDDLRITQKIISTDAAKELQVTLDKGSYSVAKGQTLTVKATVSANVKYKKGSHAYIAYFACMKNGSWQQLGAWYVDGGTSTYTICQKMSNWKDYGSNLFVFSIFPADKFAAGCSLIDKIFVVNVLKEQNSTNTGSVKKVSIAKAKISGIKTKTYTGKQIKQKISVTISGKKLKAGRDYQIQYKKNVKVGKATLIIKGKGTYKGTIVKTFKIRPKKAAVKSVSTKKKTATVKWKRQNAEITGYQIQYSKSKNFKSKAKIKTVKQKNKTSITLKKLKSKQIYYVRIRTYKKVGSKKYYSSWSKAKKFKMK